MSLASIVHALGGELYDRGRRANVPAPGHSAADRSVSLLLRDGRIIANTFGDGDWKGVLDHLRSLNLIDAHNAPRSLGSRASGLDPGRPSDRDRVAAALAIWDDGRRLEGTLSGRHCAGRHIVRPLPDLEVARHGAQAPVSAYRPGGMRRPALLVAIRDAWGGFSGLEVTYLSPDGSRARELRLPRKTVGLVPAGSAVRIDPAGRDMLVAEGVFTTLSATERFGLPGWALMSTRNLRSWRPPAQVRSVLIAADRGRDGAASAAVLADRLSAEGLKVRVLFPAEPFGDFNEQAGAGR